MAMTCSACRHEARDAIDKALVAGTPYRDIAAQYGVTPSSLTRHRRSHLSPALVAVAAKRQTRRAESLVDRLEMNIGRLERSLQAARDVRSFIAANAEIRKTLELLARLSGELDERPQSLVINVAQTAEWVELRSMILRALAPFPEAKHAVVLALTGQVDDARVLEGEVVEP